MSEIRKALIIEKYKIVLEKLTKKGESPQKKSIINEQVKWKLICLNKGEPSSKAKYNKLSDSEKYREGKMKRELVN